jgi:CelD/BcsL family acetyltransferase involved in cellulose biosynthesis
MKPWSIVPFSDLADRREDWTRLAQSSRNIFASWEWATTWWKHHATDGTPAFRACLRPDGEAFAILPLYLARRGRLRVLRFIGHGPGDVLGPVCAIEDESAAGAALRAVLAQQPRRRLVFLAERLPPGSVGQAIGGTVIQRESNPYLEIAGASWDEFLASRSRNLRQQVGRRARKLEKEHAVRFRLCDEPERLDEDFDTLMRLHAARWGHAGAFAGARGRFHRDFAWRALEAGWLRLWVMEADDRPVAAWYGFRFAGVESFYQSGRDPAWERLNVGFVLLTHTIRAAFDDGMERYSFLRGDEPYKDRFSSGDRGLETRAVANGPPSAALVRGGVSITRRFPAVRRHLVRTLR